MENQSKFRTIYSHPDWKKLIAPRLAEMLPSKELIRDQRIIQHLNVFQNLMIRSHKTLRRSYHFLRKNFMNELSKIFGSIAEVVMDIEKYENLSLNILYSGKDNEITLKKSQVIFLLCLMCLNLIPAQHYDKYSKLSDGFHGLRTFSFIFSEIQFKTVAIITYLKLYFKNKDLKSMQNQKLTIRRKVNKMKLFQILQFQGNSPLCELQVRENYDSIEKFTGSVKVDFANRYIGGGAMNHGAVQEEIMFATHPQMYIAILFCEQMRSNEAIEFIGFKRYFDHKGYRQTTSITGINQNLQKQYQLDEFDRAKQYIVAIDAFNFEKGHQNQFDKKMIDREIGKAYIGFMTSSSNSIATGKWGCGAFGGDPQLKFLMQWVAASLAKKQKIIYCPFGNRQMYLKYEKFQNTPINIIYQSLFENTFVFSAKKVNFVEQIQKNIKNSSVKL